MRTPQRPLPLLAVTLAVTLALTVALTGCRTTQQQPTRPNPSSTPSPLSPTAEGVAGPDTDDAAPPAADPANSRDDTAPATSVPPLTAIWLADAPTGTGPQIALRFLRALQHHDDLSAALELHATGRYLLATTDLPTLHRVMRDVRRHAQLDTTGPCTRATQLNTASAVATCGRTKVVVHVPHDTLGSGVQISDWHVHRDVYRGQHTHAYTSLEL